MNNRILLGLSDTIIVLIMAVGLFKSICRMLFPSFLFCNKGAAE